MGILNVTADSFSDGGQWLEPDDAVGHGLKMAAKGADVIDVGGESTRPGSRRIPADEQTSRILTVIERLRRQLDQQHPNVAISVDTTLADVATAALDTGADMINDVSAGREDRRMLDLAGARRVPIVLMHMQGTPATMQQAPRYDDVVREVEAFLIERAEAAVTAGVPHDQILIDPGIGFGKTRAHNLALLAHLDQLANTGFAVLLGTSRKRFMGSICQQSDGPAPPPSSLVAATCATTALGVAGRVAMFRVHDVHANRQAAEVAWNILDAESQMARDELS